MHTLSTHQAMMSISTLLNNSSITSRRFLCIFSRFSSVYLPSVTEHMDVVQFIKGHELFQTSVDSLHIIRVRSLGNSLVLILRSHSTKGMFRILISPLVLMTSIIMDSNVRTSRPCRLLSLSQHAESGLHSPDVSCSLKRKR